MKLILPFTSKKNSPFSTLFFAWLHTIRYIYIIIQIYLKWYIISKFLYRIFYKPRFWFLKLCVFRMRRFTLILCNVTPSVSPSNYYKFNILSIWLRFWRRFYLLQRCVFCCNVTLIFYATLHSFMIDL